MAGKKNNKTLPSFLIRAFHLYTYIHQCEQPWHEFAFSGPRCSCPLSAVHLPAAECLAANDYPPSRVIFALRARPDARGCSTVTGRRRFSPRRLGLRFRAPKLWNTSRNSLPRLEPARWFSPMLRCKSRQFVSLTLHSFTFLVHRKLSALVLDHLTVHIRLFRNLSNAILSLPSGCV
jgi:hypothetical protein